MSEAANPSWIEHIEPPARVAWRAGSSFYLDISRTVSAKRQADALERIATEMERVEISNEIVDALVPPGIQPNG